MNEIVVRQEFNNFPTIIQFDEKNPTLRSPYATLDLQFYCTRDTLMDVDVFRSFLKNAEGAFRASKEYKAYKSYLIEYCGINRCQIFGNITTEDAEIELHHNVMGLFDICLLIASHIVSTVGVITTFDLVELLIQEHWANRVGVVFLCKTAHQMFTNNPEGYLPPDMTFGRWWELLSRYKYGITYDLANKIINYLDKYQKNTPTNIIIPRREEIMSFAYFNEYGWPEEDCGFLPNNQEFEGGYENEY